MDCELQEIDGMVICVICGRAAKRLTLHRNCTGVAAQSSAKEPRAKLAGPKQGCGGCANRQKLAALKAKRSS